jgi:hypothetical protein
MTYQTAEEHEYAEHKAAKLARRVSRNADDIALLRDDNAALRGLLKDALERLAVLERKDRQSARDHALPVHAMQRNDDPLYK